MIDLAEGLDCPICAKSASETLFTLAFRRSGSLPDQISMHACRDCDLVFSWPRDPAVYDLHYAEVANDFLNSGGKFRNREQLERLSRFIGTHGLTRVMDFGCGGGGLAAALAARHPQVEFVGYDVNGGFPPAGDNLTCSKNLPDGRFDLVILSHVLEHAIDPVAMIGDITSRYQPKAVYIEVPSPEDYRRVGQPQYLYYIDRLHINHFGLKALLRLMGGTYRLAEYGRYDMPYDLGPLYPCQYALFTSAGDGVCDVETAIGLYRADQMDKVLATKAALQNRAFYIYGFGDNFFRNRSPGGPLSGLDGAILGIIDRNIDQYRDLLPAGWRAVHPNDMGELNGTLIVCAVTQSGGLGALFQALCPDSELIYL